MSSQVCQVLVRDPVLTVDKPLSRNARCFFRSSVNGAGVGVQATMALKLLLLTMLVVVLKVHLLVVLVPKVHLLVVLAAEAPRLPMSSRTGVAGRLINPGTRMLMQWLVLVRTLSKII